LTAVLGYIREHLHAAVTLRDLAAVAHLSPYHFARRFKESTGLPPRRYIIARRIERAQQLPRGEDDLSLAQVAARVGFSDQGHFARHFRRLVGVTPKRFRCSTKPCKNNPVRALCRWADAHDGAGTLGRIFGHLAGISEVTWAAASTRRAGSGRRDDVAQAELCARRSDRPKQDFREVILHGDCRTDRRYLEIRASS
jgi:AraC-like DNA-binding protein